MPERHKETNRFRFRSFNERVQNVRVSAIYRIKTDRAVRQAAEGQFGSAGVMTNPPFQAPSRHLQRRL